MKNVVLSVVVVAVLAAGGLSGTFAHFSDTEESKGNYVQAGSLDLKVSDGTGAEFEDEPWGEGVPALVFATDLQKASADFNFDLHNTGQPAGHLCRVYMHVKELVCEDVEPHKGGILCPGPDGIPGNADDKLQPEPEVVAEHGGWQGQTWVNGLGCCFGSDCDLAKHIDCTVWFDLNDNGDFEDDEEVYDGKLDGIVCKNLLLGPLPKCTKRLGHIVVRLQNIDEDDLLKFAGVDNDGDGAIDEDPRDGKDNDNDGMVDEDPAADDNPATPDVDEGGHFDGMDNDIAMKCWDHWPTNALMKDKVTFNILFSLVDD